MRRTSLTSLKVSTGKGKQETGGRLPSPYSGEFQLLDIDKKLVAYRKAVKRVNQQLREVEKAGLEEINPAYVALKKNNEIVERTGNVGFTFKFRKSMYTRKKDPMSFGEFNQKLLEEYKKVYYYRQGGSSTLYESDIEMHQRRTKYEKEKNMKSKMARLGIRAAYMDKERNKQKISDYWDLYNELDATGIFESLNLGSDDAQDLTLRFFRKNKFNKLSSGDLEAIKKEAEIIKDMRKPERKEITLYNYIFGDDLAGSEIMDDKLKDLIKTFAKKHYGTPPVRPDTGNTAEGLQRNFGRD